MVGYRPKVVSVVETLPKPWGVCPDTYRLDDSQVVQGDELAPDLEDVLPGVVGEL